MDLKEILATILVVPSAICISLIIIMAWLYGGKITVAIDIFNEGNLEFILSFFIILSSIYVFYKNIWDN